MVVVVLAAEVSAAEVIVAYLLLTVFYWVIVSYVQIVAVKALFCVNEFLAVLVQIYCQI